jgi:hypothetical protein
MVTINELADMIADIAGYPVAKKHIDRLRSPWAKFRQHEAREFLDGNDRSRRSAKTYAWIEEVERSRFEQTKSSAV